MSAPTPAGTPTEHPPDAARDQAPAGEPTYDWATIAATPEFEQLHRSRRRFTLTGMLIQTGALLVVMGLLGWAPDTMGKNAIGSVTWALVAGAALVVLTFVMALAYSAQSRRWGRLAEGAIANAGDGGTAKASGRFAR
jgi:uncharacterized membrane protein (DUF485 family)